MTGELTRSWHSKLFPEEYDFIHDDLVDYKARKRGVDPMIKTYQEKSAAFRKKLGLSPFDPSGRTFQETFNWTKEKLEVFGESFLEETLKFR